MAGAIAVTICCSPASKREGFQGAKIKDVNKKEGPTSSDSMETEFHAFQAQLAVMSELAALGVPSEMKKNGSEKYCFSKYFWLWPDSYKYQAMRADDGHGENASGQQLTTFGAEASPKDVVSLLTRFAENPSAQNQRLKPSGLASILLSSERMAYESYGSVAMSFHEKLEALHLKPVKQAIRSLLGDFGPVRFYRGTDGDSSAVEFSWEGQRMIFESMVVSTQHGDKGEGDRVIFQGQTSEPFKITQEELKKRFVLSLELNENAFEDYAFVDSVAFGDC